MSDDIDVLIEDIGALSLNKDTPTGPRASYSTFLITINPNKAPTTDEDTDSHSQNLKTLTKWLFKKRRLPRIIKFLNDDSYSGETIESITIKFAVEKGECQGRVHCHSTVTIKHYSRIHLNLVEMRRLLEKKLGYTPYLNVKVAKTSLPLEEYIAKNK